MFSRCKISALGTVVRMFVFRDLQIGHLSKKQEVAAAELIRAGLSEMSLWKQPATKLTITRNQFCQGTYVFENKRIIVGRNGGASLFFRQLSLRRQKFEMLGTRSMS